MAPLRVGAVIGRFQVPDLHDGHAVLIEAVQAKSDQLTILLGVSPLDGYIAENPLTFNQRQAIIRQRFPNAVILPLFDERTNDAWSAQVDELLGGVYPLETVTLYGGRNSFRDAYCGKCKVETIDLQPASTSQGTLNRAAIKEGQTADFYRGQIYALQRQWPRACQTVDIGMVRRDNLNILLIRRADSGEWCFPGGFLDPGESLERAAARELLEETGLATASPSDWSYVTSMPVNDWRYRGRRDQITTALFRAWYLSGAPVVNPTEVQDYKWVARDDLDAAIGDTHRQLADELVRSVK